MAFKLADSIQDTSTTPASGTGLSTVSGTASIGGYKTFSSFMSVGDTTWLTRRMGNDFETGVFTYTATNELTPSQIFESSNGNAAVVWTAGTKTLFCDLPASKARKIYSFEDTTEATGAGTTAAALFAGGVEIAKKLFVTGNATFSGTLAVAGNVNIGGTLTFPTGSGVGGYRETFTGTAGQTSITPTYGYTSGQIDVYRGGVRQTNGVDVTVTSGTSVVFATPLSLNETIDLVYYTLSPLTGSTQSIYQDTFTAAAAQTVITPTYTYASGAVMVFVNGIKQTAGIDYSAPGGTSITMTVAFIGGEKIELIYWQLASIQSNSVPSLATAMENNLLVNSWMDVSQENLGTLVTAPNGAAKYVVDQFYVIYSNSGGVVKGQQIAPPGSPSFGNGFPKCLQVTAPTALSSLAALDYIAIVQPVEGTRWSKLGYGAPAASPSVVGFWINSTVVGTGTLNIRTTTRAYLQNFTVNAANTWEYKILVVPGDVTGTWLTDPGTIGAYCQLMFACGSTYQGTNGVWQAGVFLGTAQTTNFFATAGNQVSVTGFTIIPGTDVIPASLTPLIRRSFEKELSLCQRFLRKSYDYNTAIGAVTRNGALEGINIPSANTYTSIGPARFNERMMKPPSVTYYSTGTGAVNKIRYGNAGTDNTGTLDCIGEDGFNLYTSASMGASENVHAHYVADARF